MTELKLNRECEFTGLAKNATVDFSEMTESDVEKYILCHYNNLIRNCKRCQNPGSRKIIDKAFKFANAAHKGVTRKNGEPYIIHPIEVARIAATEIGLGTKAISAALMHDVVEDTNYIVEDIDNLFGEKIAYLVKGLTKIELVDKKTKENHDQYSLQAENFRSLIFTISKDIRVVFLKIADRLHNMRTLEFMPRASQLRSAAETLEIYAPLAHRLGLYSVKSELEDLAFKYRDPEKYTEIQTLIRRKYKSRQQILNRHALKITDELLRGKYIPSDKFNIDGRPKTIYSIAQKMEKQGVDFDNVFDKLALRIVFEPIGNMNIHSQCWSILGMIHNVYDSLPDRLRDWIKIPKPNGYQAIHTTVMTDTGNKLEIQIRTKEMDNIAERGLASHSVYKGNKMFLREFDDLLDQVKDEMENPNSNPIDFLDKFKMDLRTPEISIFTPRGDLIKLKNGSTPLDFAFKIHTDIGCNAITAKVDNKLVSLFTKLKNGDQVQVLTSKRNKPKKEWLKHIVTRKAENILNNYFKKEERKIAEKGKIKYHNKLKELKIKNKKGEITERILNYFGLNNVDDFYINIENKKITLIELRKAINKAQSLEKLKGTQQSFKEKLDKIKFSTKKEKWLKEKTLIADISPKKVHRVGDNLDLTNYEVANCCKPLPGDEVLGFKELNINKIIIHKTTCEKANNLNSKHKTLIVPLKWTASKDFLTHANIVIEGIDRKGIVLKVIEVISNQMNVNMSQLNIKSELGVFKGEIGLYVKNLNNLNNLLTKIVTVYGVTAVYRKSSRK